MSKTGAKWKICLKTFSVDQDNRDGVWAMMNESVLGPVSVPQRIQKGVSFTIIVTATLTATVTT